MKILIYSLNYAPEQTGIGKYNTELAEVMSKKGHEVTILCAPPYYPEWDKKKNYHYSSFSHDKKANIEIIRCPLFIPRSPTTFKRIIHLLSFAITSGYRLLRFRKKFDLVLMVQPTLFCSFITLLYCRIFSSKSVMHIQDFELDAMLGLGMLKKGRLFIKPLALIERHVMQKFDYISSISISMVEKAAMKSNRDDIILFPNWADIDFVTPNTDGSKFRRKYNINDNSKLVLYSGNIGQKQGLEILLPIAERIVKKNKNLLFLIVGSGAYLDTLKRLATDYKLTNLIFLPTREWEEVPEMLSAADIHLVIQKKGAADAVLPSKLTNILSCGGRAIVTAEEHTELGKIAHAHSGIYELIEPESEQLLEDTILRLSSEKSEGFNSVARIFAVENLDKENIIDGFLTELEKNRVN